MKTYSFVIPTYNKKALLKNTLEALNYQPGYGYYEAVVVDDGSDDGTRDYIKETARNYELKYLYLERDMNSCRARTRNHGWKNAGGEVIVFIDSDIIIKPDYLAELERCFGLDDDIAVIGNRLMLPEPSTYKEVTGLEIYRKYGFGGHKDLREFRYLLYGDTSYNINAHAYPWTQFYSCNAALPKKCLEQTGGFDENFKGWGVEDIELGYELYKRNIPIVINHKLEVFHQYHGPRNDLSIKPELVPDYERNIAYFLKKHPQSLHMPDKYKYDFLKGELKDDSFFSENGKRYIGVDFRDRSQLGNLKNLLLKSISRDKTVIVVNDYLENTDLDIWIQLPKKQGQITARYFPMSKKAERHG